MVILCHGQTLSVSTMSDDQNNQSGVRTIDGLLSLLKLVLSAAENTLFFQCFFTTVPFRGNALRVSAHRTHNCSECDELTRAVHNLGKEQQ